MVLKGLILNSFYFLRVWWSWKISFWTVSTLRDCGGLERADFEQFLLLEDMIILKELILNSFYFRRVWQSWKADFEQFLLWEGVVVLKELILNSFYFLSMCWSWKNWFWTVSIFWGCGSLERTDFEQFFYFGRVWWSWKNLISTVSTLGGCGGLERTDFKQFLLWEGMVLEHFEQFLLWEGVVVLKELILNSFYFGSVWWSWKNWFWTVSILGGSGGLERTDFEQFLL